MSARVPVREALLVYGAVLLGCVALAALGFLPVVADHLQVAVGAVFLLTALEMAHWDAEGPKRFGMALGGLLGPSGHEAGAAAERPERAGLTGWAAAVRRALASGVRETAVALALALLIFPPFVVGYVLWFDPPGPFVFEWPPQPGRLVAAQLLAIALPEEAFFRGYLQTRLSDAWPARTRLLGVLVSWRALVLQAALFAIIHFAVVPLPARLAVFFPGLLFGLVRAARGGIGAALLFHAACNILAELLWRGFW